MKSVQAQATKFICAAYGKVAEPYPSMTECRVKTWRSKTVKGGATSVKLCPLRPNHQQMSPASRNMESSTSRITTDNVPNKSWLGTQLPGHPATTNSGNRYTICTCRYIEANSLQRQDARVSNCNLHLLHGLMHSSLSVRWWGGM